MAFLSCGGPESPLRVVLICALSSTTIRWPLAILIAVVLPLRGSLSFAVPIPFVFQYNDAAGIGFNDPVNGPQRKAALEFAGNVLGNLLDQSYSTETINVAVQFTPLSNGLIGQAGPATYHINQSNLQLDTFYGGALANHLVGMDLDPANPEISARFDINSVGQFYFGTDSMNPANSYDFVQLAMHELVHGLSFTHNFMVDGTLDGTYPEVYTRFVQVGQGMGATPLLNLSQQDRATALVGGSLYWSGPAGKLASGANEPQLHVPAMFLPASSVSHLSEAVYTTSLMTPALGIGPTEASHVVSAIERGMLRDMGWHIPVGGILWTGGGGNDVWSNPANWQNGVVPQSRDTLTFGPTAQTQVNPYYGFENPLLAQSNSTFESINFTADAPSYLLLFNYTTETTIVGAGVINNSANSQTIRLKNLGPTYFTDVFGPAAKLLFRETATAGSANVHYEVENGFIFYTEDETGITRLAPAEIGFYDNATAGGANFLLKGGGGDGSFGGIVRFYDNSTAANATFTVEYGKSGIGLPAVSIGYGFGGELLFYNFSSASTATVENLGQTDSQGHAGYTEFFDFATADHAVLNNRAATMPGVASGFTFFAESSTAADATILNEASISSESGKTGFYGFSTAAQATITNQGPMANFQVGGRTIFYDNAIAGNAEIINQGNGPGIAGNLGGRTEFRNDSSADHATVRLLPGVGSPGAAFFYDSATGGNANIQIETSNGGSGGLVEFRDQSTAGYALITIAAQSLNASLKFFDNASASDATIILANTALGAVDFHGSSSGGTALISVGFQNYLNFRETSTAGDAEIVIASGAYGQFIGLNNPSATPTTTAGTADITLQSGGIGGSLNFSAFSTAGDANIVNEGGTQPGTKGGDLAFNAGSRAGNATIITQGGTGGGLYAYTRFTSGALGENARLITTAGGIVDFSGNRYFGGTSVGLIEGAGTTTSTTPSDRRRNQPRHERRWTDHRLQSSSRHRRDTHESGQWHTATRRREYLCWCNDCVGGAAASEWFA